MIYVFDTNSFIVTSHYFPSRFPTFWRKFDNLVSDGRIISVREVFKELDCVAARSNLLKWAHENKELFIPPCPEETRFVRELFTNPHFQQLISAKQRLKSSPVADPFVIASAFVRKACVVTEEKLKENAAKIPNICAHYKIACMSIETFMENEGWSF
jgi:hypothetical protein